MERKLRDLESLEKMDYKAYRRLLKSTLKELINSKEEIEFVLVKGDLLPWESSVAENKEEQPLLYVGPTRKWVRELKDHDDLELEDYSFGVCKAVQVGKDTHVYLDPEKGKLTDTTRLKPIDKLFRKFRPKIFLEVVADLKEVEDGDAETAIDENSDLNTTFRSLGKQFEKYHKETLEIKEKFKETDAVGQQKLRIKYKQTLNRLKNLCFNWEEDILPHKEQLSQGEEAATWMRIYDKWSLYFEKRQDVKDGKSEDQEAIKQEEERLYTKTLEDLDRLFTNVEKSKDLDPSIIEVNLQNLQAHVDNWKQFTVGKESHFQNELKAVEEKMEELNQDWITYKPYLERFHETYEDLEEADASNDVAGAKEELEDIQQIIEEISNL